MNECRFASSADDAERATAAVVDPLDMVVILPCYNEAHAIASVVADMRAALPTARIHVFDNNSTDDTAGEARRAGAHVHRVGMQGKGNVIRQAFALLDADIYLIADGDGTYDARSAPELVRRLVVDELDMVVGARRSSDPNAYRHGHRAGNWLFNVGVRMLFGREVRDIFSGYRVMSRPFVKSFPALATGFETETELFLHAVSLRLPFAELQTAYGARQRGSHSKLNSIRDGTRIALYMLRLLKHVRPLVFFGMLTGIAVLIGLLLGLPVVFEYLETGQVLRFPTAFAAASVFVIAAVCLSSGLALDGVSMTQREQKRLVYLSVERWRRDPPC